ncbi:hypothetical protein CAEBREN_13490 [Caenorhabditis brenneri]|uniref:RING-type domain-containing protein n=1 Tax=Caenorhabditis brenneri TaxID=135651 RepID=G0NSH6_CAEBE|nr:hypothetical protein CAEBREN_13490 [Caenorhabditis brenneri]
MSLITSLFCPLCQEPYNDDDKRPRLGSCGHSVCHPCIESPVEDEARENADCPICEKENAFSEVLYNFDLCRMLEAFNKRVTEENFQWLEKNPQKLNIGVCKGCSTTERLRICVTCAETSGLFQKLPNGKFHLLNGNRALHLAKSVYLCSDCIADEPPDHHQHVFLPLAKLDFLEMDLEFWHYIIYAMFWEKKMQEEEENFPIIGEVDALKQMIIRYKRTALECEVKMRSSVFKDYEHDIKLFLSKKVDINSIPELSRAKDKSFAMAQKVINRILKLQERLLWYERDELNDHLEEVKRKKMNDPVFLGCIVTFLLLLFLIPSTASDNYFGVNVPTGVGKPQTDRKVIKPFGLFNEAFTKCGKTSVTKINEAWTSPMTTEVYVDCEPTPTRMHITLSDDVSFNKFERDWKQECELLTCSTEDLLAKGAKLKMGPNVNATFTDDSVAQTPDKSDDLVCEGKKWEWPVKPENLERVPFIFPPPTPPTITFKQCDTTCDKGTVVKIKMRPLSFKSMIYLDPKKCGSFRICFSPKDFTVDDVVPTCNPDYIIDVLFKNGVVVWAKKGRASVIEMMSPYHDLGHMVAIEFGYGVKSKQDAKKVSGEFYIGNDHREFVTSDSNGYPPETASQLAFMFPTEDCLMPMAGIFSKDIENGKSLTEKDVVKGNTYNEQGEAITAKTAEQFTTTTEQPVFNFVKTTTPEPIRVIPEASALVVVAESEAQSRAVYSEGKWWTWGVYLGFVIGTLLTLGIGGGVFYLLRRTVFGVWYRGMYKRYGCDASGTTGGITGIGFGNTTTAMQTIAPGETGNTMGATTGGTTTGTTGGGTTGGTTGNLTSSTSGTSTIAM